MSSELRVVGKNGLVAHLAIVGQMHIGHDPIVVANAGHASVVGGPDVEGTKLTDRVSRPYLQARGLACVFFILRHRTQGIELKDLVLFTDLGVPFNHTVRTNLCVARNFYMGANACIGPNAHAAIELSFWINQCGGMNQAHGVKMWVDKIKKTSTIERLF